MMQILQNNLSQEDILQRMYSKHLVNVSYLQTMCKKRGLEVLKIENPTDLFDFDQDHFKGKDATQKCIDMLSIDNDDIVLDIGSGFGGPARYISYKTGAKVTGVEIQKDRFDFSVQLTNSVNMNQTVDFILGDFNEIHLRANYFSKCIAFLSILHIIDKKKTIQKIGKALRQDGMIYFEDYYLPHFISENENAKLLNVISCPNLLLKDEYISELENNNIQIERIDDMTPEWMLLAQERAQLAWEHFEENKNIWGIEKTMNAMEFAKGVSNLFEENIIKGFRVIGRKK
ncbi:MAG: methyltransferase domain-containing protein [Paludibacter sp.]|nr:methyltransferase domain-containing protein [Paludibacter sp.]